MNQTESQNTKRIYMTAGSLYFAGYGLMLAYLSSYFWDDWFNYFDVSLNEFRHSTGPFSGYNPFRVLLEGYVAENAPSLFRLLIFVLYPVSAVFLLLTLKRVTALFTMECYSMFLLFLLIPVNSSRTSMTNFGYALTHCAFFIGWWLFSLDRRWWTFILSLGFFLMSFDTASFLVFIAIPLLHSYLEHRGTGSPFITWIKRNFVFVLIPIAYWFIEPIINPTLDSVRAAYYTPSLSGILRGLVVGMLVALIAAYFVLIRGWRYRTHRGGVQVLVGLLITWLGMFPYMALGHFPNLNALLIGFVPGASDWDSRHQLLMPLGLGIVVVGVLNFLNPSRLWAGVLVVCGLSTVLNLTFSQEYYLDSIKTQRIIEAFRSNPDVKEFDMALIDDQALRFNARGRGIRSYEWDYMLKAANPGLEQTTDVFRYVDCNVMDPDAIIVIQASNGKLETLLTRNPGITVSVQTISVCNK